VDLSRLSGSTETGPGTTRSTRGHPIRVPAWAWPAQTSGGYEIRTREGVTPTRFPSLCTGVRQGSEPFVTWARSLGRTSVDRRVRQRMRPELRPSRAGYSEGNCLIRRRGGVRPSYSTGIMCRWS